MLTENDLPPNCLAGATVWDGEGEVYWCMGDHGRWYRLDAAAGECNCPDWVHRRSATRTPCKHLTRLTQLLADIAAGRWVFRRTSLALLGQTGPSTPVASRQETSPRAGNLPG